MTTRTHWKKLFNPEYIGAYWLPDGEDVTVTIDFVQREVVTGTGGKKEECSVAHLQGHKPFILNATNNKTIASLYGPYIEDWAGQQITLFASTARLGGDTVECLRIRPVVAQKKLPPITPERFGKALKAIQEGTYTADKLYSNFVLSIDQINSLDALMATLGAIAEANESGLEHA